MMSTSPSLPELARSYEGHRELALRSIADIPSSTPQAEALAKQLKAPRYRFVGPTSVYAFMQNVGMVNDHVRGASERPARTNRQLVAGTRDICPNGTVAARPAAIEVASSHVAMVSHPDEVSALITTAAEACAAATA
jgi:hypothetical protein